jgi:hypothetical protein
MNEKILNAKILIRYLIRKFTFVQCLEQKHGLNKMHPSMVS